VAASGVRKDGWQRDPRAGWFVVAVGSLGLLLLAFLLAMAWRAFATLDAAISGAIWSTRTEFGVVMAHGATFLGSTLFVVPVTVLLVLWMGFRRNWAGVVYVFMTIAVGWFLGNDVIKNIVRRPRPVGVNLVPLPHDYSLPSGHALAAYLLFATVCVVAMLNLPTGHHFKRWLAIVSAVIILAVGWSRVYLGVHWFGDIVAALLIGAAWWLFTTATYFGSVTEERRATLGPGATGSSD